MRPLPRPALLAAASSLVLGGLATVALTAPAAQAAPAQTAYALSGTTLLSFDPGAPTTTTSTAITNVTAGETLVGIDVRPQNGYLYALGVNATADTGTLYVVSRTTGYAGVVGTAASSVKWTTDGTTAVDLPDPATTTYGFDVNPAADRLRITAATLNARVDPNTGAPVDGDTTANGVNPDGSVNGGSTTVGEVAYTSSRPSVTATTLYTLDAATDSLYVQTPPNNGTQTAAKAVNLAAGLPLDFTRVGGFDIDPAVVAATANGPVTAGTGFAVLTAGGVTGLYAIDLTNGQATLVGAVGNPTATISGLALQGDVDTGGGRPIVALSTDGLSLNRFQSQTPGTAATVAVGNAQGAVVVGERLVGIAWRPNTGQLIGLGVNATADTASLYVVDPQTGAATVIGSNGSVTYQTDMGAVVDLPDPATTGYGVDVNPTVDRVRIVATNGLNARARPDTGVAFDGDLGGTAGSVPNTNTDGPSTPGLSAASYTNAVPQGTGGVTTEYALEAGANQLVVVNPPNVGTLTQQKAVTAGGKPLDFAMVAALDIPGTVTAASANAVATGNGFAALSVGGTSTLYSLDLGTAVASPIGALTTAVRSIAVGEAVGDAAVAAVPTPTTSPTATPTAKPTTATVATTGKPSQQKKTVLTGVTLTCPATLTGTAASCSATVVLKAKVKVRVGGKVRKKSVVIGKGGLPFDVGDQPTIDVPRGSSAPLTVKLNGKGKKLLKAAGRLKATTTLTTPTGTNGAAVTTTLKVTLKAKKL